MTIIGKDANDDESLDRMLFVNSTSAFNTITPTHLLKSCAT